MNNNTTLESACARFKEALANPYAIQRREAYIKARNDYLARAWKLARR